MLLCQLLHNQNKPMASSISSTFRPKTPSGTQHFISKHPQFPHKTHLISPPRTPLLSFSIKNSSSSPINNNDNGNQTAIRNPDPEKKSFGLATGELFIGIASRILKSSIKTTASERKGSGNRIPFFRKSNNDDDDDENRIGGGGDYEERIGAVMVDDVEPGVMWEQRVKDIEAEKKRRVVTSPGFSFSAAGLLFPYHLGVAHFLIEKGYIKETTPLAGSSAGAIVCAVIASGASMQEALNVTKVLAEDCRQNGTAFRLGAVLRDVLINFLPDDVHSRSNGRVRVAVTQVLWRPRGLLVDRFDSKEDLINAVVTSSFIPGYLAPRPVTLFRRRVCIDGGFTLFMPPTSAAQTVHVCAFPASQLGLQKIGISPDCNPENRASPRMLFNWAMEPGEDAVLDWLFELGYLDAAVWAEQNPVEKVVKDDIPSDENSQ